MKTQCLLQNLLKRLRLYAHIIIRELKVAQYSFFGVRGIGTNGVSAQVFITNFYFEEVTKNKLGVFQRANFFVNWH